MHECWPQHLAWELQEGNKTNEQKKANRKVRIWKEVNWAGNKEVLKA